MFWVTNRTDIHLLSLRAFSKLLGQSGNGIPKFIEPKIHSKDNCPLFLIYLRDNNQKKKDKKEIYNDVAKANFKTCLLLLKDA